MVKWLYFLSVVGSEGKLTLTEQKISVLQAIGNMTQNAVSGATTLQDLAGSVVELFIPLLSTEGTIVIPPVTVIEPSHWSSACSHSILCWSRAKF